MGTIIRNKQTGEFCHFSQKKDSFCIRLFRNGHGFVEVERGKDDKQELENIWQRYEVVEKSPFKLVIGTVDIQFWADYFADLRQRETNGRRITVPDTGVDPVKTPRPEIETDLADIVAAVEKSINTLIDEFKQNPYLHRVEHSLHTQLVNIMTGFEVLQKKYGLGDGRTVTQLVHKEWPETRPRPEKSGRRGNFDIAVLSPARIAQCGSKEEFKDGRIAAPVVIEIGLDYAYDHLRDDKIKLENSQPQYGYLIHLVRDMPKEPQVEKLLLETGDFIKTAYVLASENELRYKKLGDTGIITEDKHG